MTNCLCKQKYSQSAINKTLLLMLLTFTFAACGGGGEGGGENDSTSLIIPGDNTTSLIIPDAPVYAENGFCSLNAISGDYCEDFELSLGDESITGDAWTLSPRGSSAPFRTNSSREQYVFEYDDQNYAAFSGQPALDLDISKLELNIYFTDPGVISYDIKHFYCDGARGGALMDGVNVSKSSIGYGHETASREEILVPTRGLHSFTFYYITPYLPNCTGNFIGIIVDNILATNAIDARTTNLDLDGDGIHNQTDNCPNDFNVKQLDIDNDGIGNACDLVTGLDTDNDLIADINDNCPIHANPSQINQDNDEFGDACDSNTVIDSDIDGIADSSDNCPDTYNPLQHDDNGNGVGNPCDVPPAQLIASYSFAKGAPELDTSGNEETLRYWGDAIFLSDSGVKNHALILGEERYASLPIGIVSTLGDFTISTYVRLDTVENWSRIFDFGGDTSSYMFLTAQSGISGAVSFAITNSGGGAEQRIHGIEPLPQLQSLDDWTHVAVTKSGNVGTLYVNGAVVGSNTNMTLKPSDLGATTQNWLGRSQYSADPYLDGSIDEFNIYDRALSAGEIRSIAGPNPAKITIMGTDVQVSVQELKNSLAKKNMTFVNTNELKPNECTILYANADRDDISAEAGVLTCSTTLENGDIKLTADAIYGGCDVARIDQDFGGGSRCSVGVASAGVKLKVSDNPAIYNEMDVSGPAAEECTAISTENTCFGAGATVASASYGFKSKNGSGLGAGVAVGVGAGFSNEYEDGVLSGSIDVKLGIGFSIDYSISGDDILEVAHLGEAAFLEHEDEIVAVGNKSLKVFESVGDDVIDVGDKVVGNIEVSGEVVLVYLDDVGNTVVETYDEVKSAAEVVAKDIETGVVSGANTVYNGLSSASSEAVVFVGDTASDIGNCFVSLFSDC